MNIIRHEIVIADTQTLIIEGLKSILGNHFGISGIAGSKTELSKLLRDKSPVVVILDYWLLDFNSFDELSTLKKQFSQIGFIILTNHISNQDIHEFNKAGIRHLMHKSADASEIFQCIEAVQKGKKYYSEFIIDLLVEQNNKKSILYEPSQLTVSEIDILHYIAEGMTNKEIAAKKCLSIHTITTHRKNILRKLDVSNASELIMVALKKGLIGTIDYQI